MNTIEKIRAEVERRQKIHYENYGAFAAGQFVEDTELLSFLDTLEESERPEPYNPVYDEAYLNEKIKKATESWKGVDVDAMLAECRGYDEEKSEKPMNQEELEKEIERYCGARDSRPVPDLIEQVARHFAKWGAEHLASVGKTLEIKPGDEVTINGHKIVYDKDKGYVTIAKSEESVPADLEEAAEKHASSVEGDYAFSEGPDHYCSGDLEAAFIAGAEWAFGLGVHYEDRLEVIDSLLLLSEDESEYLNGSGFNNGDKVIVQIRKI